MSSPELPEAVITPSASLHIVSSTYETQPDSATRPITPEELAPSTYAKLGHIAFTGQTLMVTRHGRVFPDMIPPDIEHGVKHLGYNNGDHTQEFAEKTEVLADFIDREPLGRQIDKVVATWHDEIQTTLITEGTRQGIDERDSAELVVKALRKNGLPPNIALTVAEGVLGTWPTVDTTDSPMGQWATSHDDYPTDDARRAAYIGATCDLAGIYSARGPLMGSYLYAQRQNVLPQEIPKLTDYGQFVHAQMSLLENHRFPIEVANRIFTTDKEAVIRHTNEKLMLWQHGSHEGDETDIWRRILEMDKIFYREHS
jgi:hypothetical protein